MYFYGCFPQNFGNVFVQLIVLNAVKETKYYDYSIVLQKRLVSHITRSHLIYIPINTRSTILQLSLSTIHLLSSSVLSTPQFFFWIYYIGSSCIAHYTFDIHASDSLKMDLGQKLTVLLFLLPAMIVLTCPSETQAGCCCPTLWTAYRRHCYRLVE